MIESVQELTGDIATNQTLTGELDYRVTGGKVDDVKVNGTSVVENKIANIDLTSKQDVLVSGTNIKTINNESILGSGNLEVQGQTIQVETMPTASASELGNIYQYVGNDTNDYVNGYFYKCILKNNDYLWNNCFVDKSVGFVEATYPGSYKKVTDKNLQNAFQIIVDYFNKTNMVYSYFYNGCDLKEVKLLNQNEQEDYKRYELTFCGIQRNSGRFALILYDFLIYTHYSTTELYDDTTPYYPRTNTTYENKVVAYYSDLDNYASKTYVNSLVGNINDVLATLTTPGGN